MAASPPPVLPRKHSGVRVMIIPGEEPPPGGLPVYRGFSKENGASVDTNYTNQLNAEREVEIMNHCFDDVERFMARLQQTAEAQTVLNQRRKKRNRKSKKKEDQDDDLLTLKALPPSEEEFVEIFQKIKYSLCLLDRLKSSIKQPDAPELLHSIFVPLRLMVKTTGGPALGASVLSPAMTSGAVSLLQEHLTKEERELWTSLGPNWTSPRSQLSVSVPPYSPVFLDGWQPQAYDSTGQLFEDPIESQHKQDSYRERREAQIPQDQAQQTAEGLGDGTDEVNGNGLPPEGERLYCCSYDFVARNSSELSVLQGETLEVIESSKRWWKCRNRFDQIGFVPFNILEPLSALNNTGRDSPVVRRESKKTAITPRPKYFSYAPPSPVGTSPTSPMRPQSMILPSPTMPGEDSDRVMVMNEELLQRLAVRRDSARPPVVPRTADTSTPLNYHSPAAEVEAWLTTKGFSQQTVQSLAILNGAQLFSLNKEELRTVSPDEGSRVYSQIMVQKALLEDVRKTTELERAMEKQKLRIEESDIV
ncbi:epidermal growth factor receptor kinase substrate 8-like protein 1a [Plectropomus leopardus]|uniref:epidermal growth factor receptor kinase substrate 8-like protein 1a n=1 Tax=Plectropomus leopardus TaxID=160734 RepID=UPI001C4C2CD0|nr:epidermal growth factor receptor kinase substrate 8-like protein 1a [Plectropomus leopardus]